MLISDKRLLRRTDTNTARSGMFDPGVMCDRYFEKGTPLSRAKDHSWREAVATSEIHDLDEFSKSIMVVEELLRITYDVSITAIINVMTVAPA